MIHVRNSDMMTMPLPSSISLEIDCKLNVGEHMMIKLYIFFQADFNKSISKDVFPDPFAPTKMPTNASGFFTAVATAKGATKPAEVLFDKSWDRLQAKKQE